MVRRVGVYSALTRNEPLIWRRPSIMMLAASPETVCEHCVTRHAHTPPSQLEKDQHHTPPRASQANLNVTAHALQRPSVGLRSSPGEDSGRLPTGKDAGGAGPGEGDRVRERRRGVRWGWRRRERERESKVMRHTGRGEGKRRVRSWEGKDEGGPRQREGEGERWSGGERGRETEASVGKEGSGNARRRKPGEGVVRP
eukprot:1321886-Rhodomonas_salina.1